MALHILSNKYSEYFLNLELLRLSLSAIESLGKKQCSQMLGTCRQIMITKQGKAVCSDCLLAAEALLNSSRFYD